MSRTPRKFTRPTYVSLPLYQHAIIHFYARRYLRDGTDVFRTIISQYARADPNFDSTEYQRFVAEDYLEMMESDDNWDDEQLRELDRQVRAFLGKEHDNTLSLWEPDQQAKKGTKRGKKR